MRTVVGLLEVVSVEAVDEKRINLRSAGEAGFETVADLLRDAGNRGETLYRVGVRHLGPDPRIALREGIPDKVELIEIGRRLDRLDAGGGHGPWTHETMSLIEANPGVRAEDLALLVGRDKKPFKLDVRKLKELGLTESLRVGYRLSPRGKAVVENRKDR